MKFITKTKAALLTMMLAVPVSASAAQSSVQRADFYDFPGMESKVGGAATLTRTRFELKTKMAMHNLGADSAYTLWWAVFNSPENCVNGPGHCGMPDLNNPAANLAVFYGSGFLTDETGRANATAELRAGTLPAGTSMLLPGMLFKGNGMHAEIMLMIRDHGPIVEGNIADQIGTHGGGCGQELYHCSDTHAASFPPAD